MKRCLTTPAFLLVLLSAGCAAGRPAIQPTGPTGPGWSVLATLRAPIQAAAPCRGGLLVAAGHAGLLRIEADTAEVTTVAVFPGQEAMQVAASDTTVWVVAGSNAHRIYQLYAVDLEQRRIMRTIALKWVPPFDPQILPDGHVGLAQRDELLFLDGNTGATIGRTMIPGGIPGGADLSGERLYLAMSYSSGGLAVFDARRPRLVDVIETDPWFTDVHVRNGRAFVVGNEGLGLIDLASESYSSIDLSVPTLSVSRSGDVWALGEKEILHLDWEGRRIAAAMLPPPLLAHMSGTWRFLAAASEQEAMIACSNQVIRVVPAWRTAVRQPLAHGQ